MDLLQISRSTLKRYREKGILEAKKLVGAMLGQVSPYKVGRVYKIRGWRYAGWRYQ